MLLSMGSHLHVDGHRTPVPLPFIVLAHLPLLDSGSASRYVSLFWLFAALLLAMTLDWVYEKSVPRIRAGWSAVVCLLVAAFALVPLVPAWPYPAERGRRAALVHEQCPGSAGRNDRGDLPELQSRRLLRHALAGHVRHDLPHAGGLRRVREFTERRGVLLRGAVSARERDDVVRLGRAASDLARGDTIGPAQLEGEIRRGGAGHHRCRVRHEALRRSAGSTSHRGRRLGMVHRGSRVPLPLTPGTAGPSIA